MNVPLQQATTANKHQKEKQRTNNHSNQQPSHPSSVKGSADPNTKTICNFEELNGEFQVVREIGRGKYHFQSLLGSYGVVFKAYRKNDEVEDQKQKRNQYAVKRIFPTINAAFILIEMLILKALKYFNLLTYFRGKTNVAEIICGYRKEGQVSIVFKYQKSKSFLTFLSHASLDDIKHYMFALLTAINGLAEVGIMHRDIKPSNFLYDKESKTGLLIDFGLSELELDSNNKPKKNAEDPTIKRILYMQNQLKIRNRTGTRGYMPPEALFNYPLQTTAVDVWAAGVIFLSLLAQRHPIFSLNNSTKIKNFTLSNLIPLTCMFGSDNIKEIAFKYGYGVMVPDEMQKNKIPWTDICQIKDEHALDLLNRMLDLDFTKRIEPKQALDHPFFASIRDGKEQGPQQS